MTPKNNDLRILRWVLRSFAVALGALHSWASSLAQSMNPDGVAYLDMADAYFRGDWGMAINATWNPLYSWILGAGLAVLRPSLEWEFPVVHLLNFLVYLLALVCFEYYWKNLGEVRLEKTGESFNSMSISEPAWLALGYLIFIWTTLYLIEIWSVSPDMLVAAIVFLAAGLLLRISTGKSGWPTYVAFGLVLGLGYLAKAAMFPLGFLFLTAAVVATRSVRRGVCLTLTSLLAFLLVSSPLIFALSNSKGRFTFGDAGRVTYVKHVNRVLHPYWIADSLPTAGTLEHPINRLSHEPEVLEYSHPVGGTYPLSYDPSYWFDGLRPRVDFAEQAQTILASARYYADLFLKKQGSFLAIVLLLLLLSDRSPLATKRARGPWALLALSLAAMGMYALVYVEGRYIGPFVALFWGSSLFFVGLEPISVNRRTVLIAGRLLVVLALIGIAAFNFDGANRLFGWDRDYWHPEAPQARSQPPILPPVQFAQAILSMGIRSGDRIAYIGDPFDAYFARLARFRIVAEIPPHQSEAFWHAAIEHRERILDNLERIGVVAVIAEEIPPRVDASGWARIENSRHFLYHLSR